MKLTDKEPKNKKTRFAGSGSKAEGSKAEKPKTQTTEELLEQYRDLVKSKAHLYYMLGGDIEDVIQEGMIGLYKAIENFDGEKGAAFKTFAELCINRQIITAIKASNRKKNGPLNSAISFDNPISSDEDSPSLAETLAAGSDTDPETVALLNEMTELLLSPDAKILSAMERDVLTGMLSGKDYKAIALEKNKSPKQIDNAIQRIRLKLKPFFTE